MYGDLGTKLARDAQRTLNLPQLPPYSTDLTASLIREVDALERSNNQILSDALATAAVTRSQHQDELGDLDTDEPSDGPAVFDPSADPGSACALLINHLAIRRNKRCLLAYLKVRTDRIEADTWDAGPIGSFAPGSSSDQPSSGGRTSPTTTAAIPTSHLSPEEADYRARFTAVVAAYKGPFTDVDLTGPLDPPGDLFIDVRVLKHAGPVETEYGTIHLTKNSQFFVRHADVAHLLQLGYLERLD